MNNLLYYFILCIAILQIAAPASGATINAADPDGTVQREESREATVDFNRDYFTGYGTDFTNMVTAPARWDRSDWITAALVTGVGVGLYDNDAKLQRWVLRNRTTTTDDIGDNVTELGHGIYTPALLGGMYLYGHFADDGKMRSTVLLSAESFILTGIVVQVLKNSLHRHRPYMGDGPRAWGGPLFNNKQSRPSFPSGHASSAFAVASVIAMEYDNIFVPLLAYSVATITALNRVSHNAHWSSDVFVASAIGYYTGKVVVSSHRSGAAARLSLAPMMDGGRPGIMMTYTF